MLRPFRATFQTITPGIEDRLHSLAAAMERFVMDRIVEEA
jgi:hypothetical protein